MFLEVVNFSKIYEKIQQAKSLQTDISNTELLLSNAISALTALSIKTANIKKLVQDIDVSNKLINQVNFSKNSAGVLAIANNLIDATLDSQVRPILGTLLDRNITSSAVERNKRILIAAIKKEVAKYGMKSADFDAIMKKMFAPGQTDMSYLIYSADGYLISYGIEESAPVIGGGGSGGNEQVSLYWFDDGRGTTPIEPISGAYIPNIRSGASVPVGTTSVYETSFTNVDGQNSFDELVYYTFIIRGQGTLKIYRNNVLHFDYPANANGQTKEVQYEYSVGEPGAWNWVTGTKTVSCNSYTLDENMIQELSIGTGVAYDENTWAMLAGDTVGIGFGIGLTRGVNMVRFEFTPSQPNSFARLINVSYVGSGDGVVGV